MNHNRGRGGGMAMPSNRHPGPRRTLFVCMFVCLYVYMSLLLGAWLFVCNLVIVKPAVCVRKPSVTATRTLCFGTPMEVIWQNVSCAFIASQVCVTVVGFGFT